MASNNTNLLCHSSRGGQKSKMSLRRLKPGFSWANSCSPGGISISCLFGVSWLYTPLGWWPPQSISVAVSSSHIRILLPLSYKDPFGLHGAHPDDPGEFPHPQMPRKVPFPYKVTFTGSGDKMWTSLGPLLIQQVFIEGLISAVNCAGLWGNHT